MLASHDIGISSPGLLLVLSTHQAEFHQVPPRPNPASKCMLLTTRLSLFYAWPLSLGQTRRCRLLLCEVVEPTPDLHSLPLQAEHVVQLMLQQASAAIVVMNAYRPGNGCWLLKKNLHVMSYIPWISINFGGF